MVDRPHATRGGRLNRLLDRWRLSYQWLWLAVFRLPLPNLPQTRPYIAAYILLAWVARFAIGALWQEKAVSANIADTTGLVLGLVITIAAARVDKRLF